jgi:hypothetical protein
MNTSADHATQASPKDVTPAASPNGHAFAIVGLVLQSSIAVGLAQFVVRMFQTFREITESGNSDPQVMATGMGEALIPLVLWGTLGGVGLLTTLATVIASTYRARWFFRSSLVFAGVYFLFYPPIGSLIAIVLVIVLVAKRNEFSRARGKKQ